MRVLHNRISNEELKRRLHAETEPRTTVSFYHYFPITDPQAFRDQLFIRFDALQVFGRIYIAHEGINAQVSVPASRFDAFREVLYGSDPALKGLRINVAVDDDGKSFWVLRMKVREKIVADGIEDPTFDMANKGKYLKAAEVNEMLEKPDTIVVDMRNHYEYEVGHFEGAIEIPSDTFRQQLPMAAEMLAGKKDQTIVMY
ncbi:MAG: rhodanese-related sulfurtransferase, partial [Chitinophagaceae bacterium]|nr:rhodanese-related sulfurtransferase [Chitinophagaceae bacterium]